MEPCFSDVAKQYCKHDDTGVHFWTAGHRAGNTPYWAWWTVRGKNNYIKRDMKWSPWDTRQPDFMGGPLQDCVFATWEYKLHDEECYHTACFVCETRYPDK